jgi:hypothetical protein
MPGEALLPPPKESDPEDVAWALSTAEALWKRGELQDAVNWVRKAAEAASEADADMRVIELAKAASELSAWLEQHLETKALLEAQQQAQPKHSAPPIEISPLPPSAEVEIDLEMSLDNAPRVELPPVQPQAAPHAPPKPPPRKPAPPAKPAPNKSPAQLVALPVDEVSSAEPEDPFAIPPAIEPPPPSSETESLHRIPSVPPAPPDFAPTPMAMPIAKSVPPDPEPPRPQPKVAPPERSARTSTAPFGFPASNETPSLANAALGLKPAKIPTIDPDAMMPAIEVPPRPGIPSPLPPANPPQHPALQKTPTSKVSPQARAPVAPPRPRLPTPPMGSVPPPAPTHVAVPPTPRVSLAPSVLPSNTGDDGVQSHVSDAPPRMAQSPRTEIPSPPKPPSILPPAAPRISTLGGFPSEPPAAATPAPASVRSILSDPERFEVLADVPDDAREALASAAEKVVLLPEEAAVAPPMVIVLQGELEVRAKGFLTRLDNIGAGQVRLLAPFAPAEGELQVIAGPKGARFLGLGEAQIESLRAAAPWVVQELEPASDDVHVVAGALRGRHGRRLDGGILDAVLSRAKTMRLGPDVKVVKQGENVRAFIMLGAGELSLRAGEGPDAPEIGTVELGEIVFAPELLQPQPAPSTLRAGPKGALENGATRGATEELLVTVPPLLELLGES